jgi:hypothetical protein
MEPVCAIVAVEARTAATVLATKPNEEPYLISTPCQNITMA